MSKHVDYDQRIRTAIYSFLDQGCLGKWYSSRERPISKILSEAKLTYEYIPKFCEVLADHGLLEFSSNKASIRYKIISNVIPDVNVLVGDIRTRTIDARREKYKERQKDNNDGYPVSKPSDLIPKAKAKAIDENGPAIRFQGQIVSEKRSKIPFLGEKKFLLLSNQIVEAKVIGVYLEDVEDAAIPTARVMCDLKYVNSDYNISEGIGAKYCIISKCPLKVMFDTADEILKHLSENVVLFNEHKVFPDIILKN